jgi:two-component system response regulator HydG
MSDAREESAGRILLIEDDAMMAHFMMAVLGKRGGFDVVHAPDPASALERARAERWDLVLTDVELPGMTGLDLLRELRRACPGVPAAVVTAHRAADVTMADLVEQADEFLEKPISPDRLRDRAAVLVAAGRATRRAAGGAR